MSARDGDVDRNEWEILAMAPVPVIFCIVCRNLEYFATGLVAEIWLALSAWFKTDLASCLSLATIAPRSARTMPTLKLQFPTN